MSRALNRTTLGPGPNCTGTVLLPPAGNVTSGDPVVGAWTMTTTTAWLSGVHALS